jgi:hypothetical protein
MMEIDQYEFRPFHTSEFWCIIFAVEIKEEWCWISTTRGESSSTSPVREKVDRNCEKMIIANRVAVGC